MTDIERLTELAKWMRETGAVRLKCGDVELELGAAPSTTTSFVQTDEDLAKVAARRVARHEELLYAAAEGFSDDLLNDA